MDISNVGMYVHTYQVYNLGFANNGVMELSVAAALAQIDAGVFVIDWCVYTWVTVQVEFGDEGTSKS